ncbi:MAG: mobile mystery protein B [Candidatus Melainabacteria bacterium]|nr:mobile mystery protein B [Candidatus Melainabacteria bacterium]
MGGLEENNTADGETPLEDASGLIPVYITTRKELCEAEFLNITEAIQHYLSISRFLNKFEITRQTLFEVHKKMFNKVWNWAGKKRMSNKNIGIPVYKIDEEIQKFIDDYNYWIKEKMNITELVTRVHHRLVWIHPFEGGNGRWSRFIANLIYYKNTKLLLKWPEDELQLKKKSSFREHYLKALKEADNGNYEQLINLHKELQEFNEK